MSKADQDYEELQLYLQQAKEEIGLALVEDRHDTRSDMDTTQAQTIIQNYANRSSGTWDLNIEETNSLVSEQFEQTSTSLKVSYDVTFKHDVSLEHDVFIAETHGIGTTHSSEVSIKPEIKLNEISREFDEVLDFHDNVAFYDNEDKNRTFEIKEETFSKESVKKFHTYTEIAEKEVQSSQIKRNISDSYLEVVDKIYNHERNENSNSFENVVLKLKGFLNERFKGDESRSEEDNSDEYLTAETDFDSIPRYSDKYGRHRLVKRQTGSEKIGYISSSENDSYLSDISNLESDFSDYRSLTSEEVKTALPTSFESKPVTVNSSEYQSLFEAQENVFREKPSGVNEDSNSIPSFRGPFKGVDIITNDEVLEENERRHESTARGFDFSKSSTPEMHIPVAKNLETEQLHIKTVDKSVDYQADVEKSLQKELDKFNLQINEIESSVKTSSLHSPDEIDGCILDNQKHNELQADANKTSCDQNFGEATYLYTGLEDIESLLKRSLNEFNRSLSEPEERGIITQGTNSVFEWDSVNNKEFDQQNDLNKYFAVLGISSMEPTNEVAKRKGRSLSNPEIPVLNWKFSPENEEDIPTEMVVGPYASMSNSYNENWNSSVFVERNVALKQRLLDDHLYHSKEKFEKSSVELVSSNSEFSSVSRQNGSSEIFDSVTTKALFTGSPVLDSETARPCPSMKSFTKELDPSPVVRPQPQVISPREKMNRDNYISFSHSTNDLDPPAIPESLDRKERVTLDKKMKHPVTPPPPSVISTELLISDTLNQHRENGLGIKENTHESQHFRKDENFRRKSADFTATGENGLDSIVIDSKLNRKSGSVVEDLKKCGALTNAFQKKQDQLYQDYNKENVDSLKSIKHESKVYSKHNKNKNMTSTAKNEVVVNKRNEESKYTEKGLPSCNGIHVPNYATISTNTSDSLKRIPKIQIKAPSLSSDDISLDNKSNSAKIESSPFHDTNKKDKIKNNVQDTRSRIEQKKDNDQQVTNKVLVKKTGQNKPVIKALEDDVSPEMQVMINSLSPVLLRRNTAKKMNRKVGSDSNESSPETEKKKQPGQQQTVTDPHLLVSDKSRNASTEEKPSESLFMDPKMTQTWHGATSANWSQIYGPQMREMMRRLNDENFDDMNSALSDKHFQEGSKTLPSSKSLLDEMHKRLCADQYIHNLSETEMARALVLLRMKSNKPLRMDRLGVSNSKRSSSFHIKMGTAGTPGSSASSESSPMLPRFSERERRHIKTSPRMQYPTKAGRMGRDKTPEPLLLSKDLKQSGGPRKEEAEIEAVEACRWLKETGFPQYAQMYEDGQFPVDIDSVEKDHDFLDKEDIQSLFRRLNTLNKCAIMKIGTPTKKESEDSEDEDQCALSDKWKYQRSSRRWSRKDLTSPIIENRNGDAPLKSASSHDSLLADQNSSSETGDSPVLDTKMHHTTADDMMLHRKNLTVDANGNATMKLSPKIRRAASERIKSAKSFLKRVESLKGRRRKPKNISDISGPVVTDNADMQAKIKHLNCKEINSTRKMETVSPSNSAVESRLQPNLDISANSSSLSTPERKTPFSSPSNESVTISSLDRTGDSSVFLSANSTFSDNDTTKSVNIPSNGALGFTPISRQNQSNNSSLDNTFLSSDYKPGKFPKVLDESIFSTSDTNVRTRSFSYRDEFSEHSSDKVRRRGSCDPRHQLHRVSIYDNVPIEEDLSVAQQELDIILSDLFQNINGLNRAINGEDAEVLHPPSFSALDNSNISVEADGTESEHAFDTVSDTRDNEVTSGTLSSPDISDHELHTEDLSHDDSAEHIECRERRDSGVGSSLTRTSSDRRRYRIRWHSFQKSHRPNSDNRNLQLCNLSAGQILILRKLSLLKLTALLEKYSPNRSGWSLTVPRFMKRNKVPDYKDKNVFGVPFTVMIQRTGQALPQCILHAMRFLRKTSRDALGIFRKSGVRSRIQKLRNEIEANPEVIDFEELQAYDVADLVKQYFRELPECLLTNKLSDIFISIFIYVPTELRLEAMQAAIVLMVDEHRDVLQSLMLFLSDISQYASEHQMTASNLAVCFGPSLFNMGGFRHPNQTPSPRRNRKNAGIPDARELMEQKAAHECLTLMIQECKKLFTIPAGTLSKCRCWHGDPVSLDELNHGTGEEDNQGYTSYIDSCIQGLLKESRDKFRGWVSVPVNSDVDVSYKKVGDGHPLRLWKCTIDVEAPPNEVLNRVLNERQVWDEDLLQWNTIEKLDKQTEVFQFVRNSLAPHPTRDFCVLRSWRSDLPKGACVLISTSIDHPRAELLGGIRAVELASRYLIEPCGTGKSRLSHISRVDIRGHSSDWYKKVWGHICANFMEKIRSSFKQKTGGPETKV